jgi:hypothetical protein
MQFLDEVRTGEGLSNNCRPINVPALMLLCQKVAVQRLGVPGGVCIRYALPHVRITTRPADLSSSAIGH